MKFSFCCALFYLVCALEVFGEQNISPKVFGGASVQSPADYPYQVSLQNLRNQHFCGGSIIDRAWVLTAAHCMSNKLTISIKVVAGTIDRTKGVSKRISLIKIHPLYNATNVENDIALIRINGVFTFTDDIRPIRLAEELAAPGALATLTGWGYTSYNTVALPIQLQALFVRVINLQVCQSIYGDLVTSKNVCTFNTIGEGGCNGDSGGPVVYNGEQIGVVSFGGLVCASTKPDVDTSVPAFVNWISGVTGIKF